MSITVKSIQDDSTCFADLSSFTGNAVDVTTIPYPVANAGNNDSICDLQYQLHAIPSRGEGEWSAASAEFSDPTDSNATVTFTDYGTHTLTWTETNWQCSDTATVNIIFYESPNDVNAGEDFSLDNQFDTILNATIPAAGLGYWQTTLGNPGIVTFSDSLSNTTNVSFGQYGKYVLLWSVKNGACAAISDSLIVELSPLKIYQGFSPNGDGLNDEFIFKLSGKNEVTVYIMDSHGTVIFQKPDKNLIKWDGTNENGEPMPSGTYYYLLKETGQKPRGGFIELRREQQ